MAKNNQEKLLSADIDSKLVDKFLSQMETRGFKKKRSVAAAIQLWISLPSELQAKAMAGALGEDVFSGLLHYLIDNEISQIRAKFLSQLQTVEIPSFSPSDQK